MAVAPVIRGGNRHVALILLEVLALTLLLLLASRIQTLGIAWPVHPAGTAGPVSGNVLFLAMSPLWIGLVQLVPVPPGIWASLPGREIYLQAMSAVQMPVDIWRPLSLAPEATWLSVLAGLPVTAAFLMAYLVSQRQLALLTRAIVFFALLQGVLGLMQASLFRQLYFDAQAYGRAIGTFSNPNHLAAYIAMTVPLSILTLRLALWTGLARRDPVGRQERHRHSVTVRGASARRSILPSLWGAVLFVQLAALLATLSRAGLGVGVLVGLGAALLLPLQKLSRRAWWWRVVGVIALCFMVAGSVGVDGLVLRIFGSGGESGRWQMIKSTWEAALTFWPVGAGLGTIPGVFPRFQTQWIGGFVFYSHSDFLQLLMECGLLFVFFAVVALWLLFSHALTVTRRLRSEPSDVVVAMQASCGLGLLAVLLHSWVEFNLRIPANAILAAFLMGAFLRPLVSKTPESAAPSRI